MRKLSFIVMVLAIVLGFTQCKKEQIEPQNVVKTVGITLKVGGNGGSKHAIDTNNGDVTFQDGDVIYVGNGSSYIGTLTREAGVFSGHITQPVDSTEIYFYFVGGLTPSTTPSAGSTSSFTVDISDQSSQMPVLSCNHVTYRTGTSHYSCTLQNQCALVKFTTATGTSAPVCVGGLYTEASIDFANNSITNNGTTGFVKLKSESETAKWAVLLPQTSFSDAEGVIAGQGYTISMPAIEADTFLTGDNAISISSDSSTLNHNRYLQWANGNLTLQDGDIVYGTLAGNYKVEVENKKGGVTVTLNNVTINGTDNESYPWAGITCLGDTHIILNGTNTVKGFYLRLPGIHIAQGKTLTISGSGLLNASSNGLGAGIGGGADLSCGNIFIQSGTIVATGGKMSAGIGAGFGNTIPVVCGEITIEGGTVTANGGWWGAGIGSGAGWGWDTDHSISTCGNISINGGTVVAEGGDGGNTYDIFLVQSHLSGAAAIGTGSALNPQTYGTFAGKSNCGKITIASGANFQCTKGGVGGNYSAQYSIGKNHSDNTGTCDTITIGGTVYYDGSNYQNGGNNYLAQSPLVYPGSTPPGTINRKFSVSSTKKVYFSIGNLQYQASTQTWQFAAHQYDKIGNDNENISSTYSGWIDLFGWGTGSNPTQTSTNNADYDTIADWGNNAIANGGNTANSGWRTLTKDEWSYLFAGRANAGITSYVRCIVNGVNGYIVLPDDWNTNNYPFTSANSPTIAYSTNTITLDAWTNQIERFGALFLPVTGYREGTEVHSADVNGDYWSSTSIDSDNASHVMFDASSGSSNHSWTRCTGMAVRLVRDVN